MKDVGEIAAKNASYPVRSFDRLISSCKAQVRGGWFIYPSLRSSVEFLL